VSTNLTRYRADLQQLLQLSDEMFNDACVYAAKRTRELTKEEKAYEAKVQGSFRRNYQLWYTEALAVIRQIIPDRQVEFEHLYRGDGKRRNIDITNFTIQDWLNGIKFNDHGVNGFDAAAMRFFNAAGDTKSDGTSL
jgi:hypothetical protein